MATLRLMASKQAHCCHSHSSCCPLLCPDSVALKDDRDQAMTTMAIRPLFFCCKHFSPKYSLGLGRWGGTEGQVRVHPGGWCEPSPHGRAWKFRRLGEPFREITVMGRWSWLCSLWLATDHWAQVQSSPDGPYQGAHRQWQSFQELQSY